MGTPRQRKLVWFRERSCGNLKGNEQNDTAQLQNICMHTQFNMLYDVAVCKQYSWFIEARPLLCKILFTFFCHRDHNWVEVGKQAQANSITEEAIKKPFFAMDDRSSPPIPIAAAVRGTGIAAAASLAVTVNGCAHRTRNWTRDERRLEGRCRKFGV